MLVHLVIVRNLSCPAVSQIWSFIILLCTFTVRKRWVSKNIEKRMQIILKGGNEI